MLANAGVQPRPFQAAGREPPFELSSRAILALRAVGCNDTLDDTVVTYSTCTDGILPAQKRLSATHQRADSGRR